MSGVFDLAHLERYVCGDDALRNELLSIFEEQAALWMARFSIGDDDECWHDAAHALKGAARAVGAWDIGEACEAAEKLVGGVPEKIAKRRRALGELSELVAVAVAEAGRLRGLAA